MAAKSTAPRSNASLNVIAPLPGLPFPAHANLTAAELLAFLPNCLKCADVVYRFVSNSGTRKAIYNMINTFRDSEVPWTANCCGSMMYKTMKVAGFQGWNLKKHNDWHADNMASWDGDKLDVGSFQTPNKPAQSVSFKSLGAGIRKFPDGDDALDLTRMVQYCLEHPAEVWVYPDDYAKLLTVLGGAQEPTKENTDAAVFVRWENRSPPLPAVRSVPPEVKRDELETDVDKTANAKRKETSTTPPRLEIGSRPGTPASAGPPEQPKPKRPKKQAKTEPLATLEDFDLDTEHRGCIQPYIRQLVSPVSCPRNAAALVKRTPAHGAELTTSRLSTSCRQAKPQYHPRNRSSSHSSTMAPQARRIPTARTHSAGRARHHRTASCTRSTSLAHTT